MPAFTGRAFAGMVEFASTQQISSSTIVRSQKQLTLDVKSELSLTESSQSTAITNSPNSVEGGSVPAFSQAELASSSSPLPQDFINEKRCEATPQKSSVAIANNYEPKSSSILKTITTNTTTNKSSDTIQITTDHTGDTIQSEKIGYQLRALRNDISALETNPWNQATTLPEIIHASSLSNELVNETLNYFVNCGKRLSQMTKTYDDNDAYLLLLQEKEVDLELAARIGQDLLKQNNQLKDSIKSLEDELAKRQDDVQQLKHELASKISLLDTFIEEEENKTTTNTSEEDTFKQQQDYLQKPSTPATNSIKPPYHPSPQQSSSFLLDNDENHHHHLCNGFVSLDYNHLTRSPSTSAEPFSSLPYHLNKALIGENLLNEDSNSLIGDETINFKSDHNIENQNSLVQSVTFQLVESNKRLCELQDELFCKGEQNLMQQEKLYHLEQQLRDSDRRLDDVSAENESLHRKLLDTIENRKELYDELKTCKQNFNELLRVFLDSQKESRISRMRNMQQNTNASFFDDLDPINDINNVSFDSFGSISYDAFMSQNVIRSVSRNTMPMSSSLLEELQESMKNEDNSDNSTNGDATDGADSGVHVNNNISSSSSRVKIDKSAINENLSLTNEKAKENKNWLGFSSFMLTTLLLLCLSVTINSSARYNKS